MWMDRELFNHHLQKSNHWANILHWEYDDETVKSAYKEFKIEEEILNTLLSLDKNKNESNIICDSLTNKW